MDRVNKSAQSPINGNHQHKLISSTFIVAGFSMLSRVLGFLRDITLAAIFGAGGAFDAFVLAFRIPNLFRVLFAEGAFAQAFVPVLTQVHRTRDEVEVRQFISQIVGVLSLVVLILIVCVEILAPLLVLVFAPGFVHDIERYHLTIQILRITFPYLLLIVLVALAGAILNTYHRFAVFAFTPILFNVALIAVALFWAPHVQQGVIVLAYGVLLGGLLQLLIQLPALKQLRLLSFPRIKGDKKEIFKILKRLSPAILGVSDLQISLIVDNWMASFLQAGSISWLYYSDRLTYLPLAVVGVTLSIVVLPSLAHLNHVGTKEQFSAILDWALRCALALGLPAAAGLIFLSQPILVTLIYHGAFNRYDVWMTSRSLIAFASGLPAYILIKILVSGFYSKQNIKTPVIVALIAIFVNLLLNIILMRFLAHAGLALATAISAWINVFILWILLLKRDMFKLRVDSKMFIVRIIMATVFMSLVLFKLSNYWFDWFNWNIWQRSYHLLCAVIFGVVVYSISLFFMGLRWRDFFPVAHDQRK